MIEKIMKILNLISPQHVVDLVNWRQGRQLLIAIALRSCVVGLVMAKQIGISNIAIFSGQDQGRWGGLA